MIDTSDILNVISDAVKYGASALAVPVKDTVKIVKNGIVVDTPKRNELFAVQTPQVFYKNKYLQAYDKAASEKNDYTDDCQLIESVGGVVHITEGHYTNIKITTPEDIDIVKVLMKRGGDV